MSWATTRTRARRGPARWRRWPPWCGRAWPRARSGSRPRARRRTSARAAGPSPAGRRAARSWAPSSRRWPRRAGACSRSRPRPFPCRPTSSPGCRTSRGRPGSFSAILDVPDRRDAWEPVYARLREGLAAGAAVYPQVSCRPMRFDFDLATGCASLDVMPCWRRWRAAPTDAARLALIADDEFRAAVKAEALGRAGAPASRRWGDVVLEEAAHAEHAPFVGRTLAEIAAARGGDAIDALLDLSAAEDLRARFSMLLMNYEEDHVGALLARPESLIALSDAGAHVSVLCDAGYATHLLGHWVRERGLFGWEEAVRRLSAMPAAIYGIPERGLLAPGRVADVVCFDPTRIAARAPEKVRDFPGGAARYVARAEGVEHVLIRGEEFMARGEWTGAHPGAVLDGVHAR